MRATRRDLAVFMAALGGSALLGLIAGFVWGAVAPRALIQEVVPGGAQVVSAEPASFIVADAWFCVITAAGGLCTGLLGVWLGVRKHGWPAAAGLVLGACAAAFAAMWLGGLIGLPAYNHQIATSAVGARFNDSLSLQSKSALAIWPLLTSATIAISSAGARSVDLASDQAR